MTIKLNYTSFDFDTIKADLIEQLESEAVFQDYNFQGSNVNTIIEVVSGVADLFNYYINAISNESYIESASIYKNLNKLVELVGYNPRGYLSSTITLDLASTIDFPAQDDYFEIPKWTTFSVASESPEGEEVKYLNPSSLSFTGTAGINSFSDELYVIQGVRENEAFAGTGEAFQLFEVADLNASEDYIEVYVDDVKWEYKSHLYRDVDDTSKVFSTRYNKNEKVEISFGDGIFGVKPSLNAVIDVYYIKSLGEDGIIGANEISGIDSTIYIIKGDTQIPTTTEVTFTIGQTSASDGGRDPLTAEEVRNYGPRAFRTQDRAVTQQDHEDLLLSDFSEFILQSITLNSDSYFDLTGESPATSGNYYNNVYMYTLPRFGDNISGNLRQEVVAFLQDYKMTTLNYVLKDLDYRNVDVDVGFKKTESTVRTQTEIANDIEAYVRDFFTRANRKIGEEIKYSDIIHDLRDIDGISSLSMALSSDIDIGWKYENIDFGVIQFPELSAISIAYSGTGV